MGGPGTIAMACGASLLTAVNGKPDRGPGEGVRRGRDGHPLHPSSGSSAANASLDIRIGVTAGTTGDVSFFKMNVNFPFSAHRMSWRLQGQ
jgi:hypothetical protein